MLPCGRGGGVVNRNGTHHFSSEVNAHDLMAAPPKFPVIHLPHYGDMFPQVVELNKVNNKS